MRKKRTPTKPQKPRKISVSAHLSWPFVYEDVDYTWALEAIQHGNGAILVRYLREADKIDPRVRRETSRNAKSDLKPHLAIGQLNIAFKVSPQNWRTAGNLFSTKSL